IIIRNSLFSIPYYVLNKDTIYMKQGEHEIQIAYGNIANKTDSSYYKVLLLSRDSILSIRKKQNI
ncbi:MAG: hypothetical protein KIB51_05230, partial [Dysgonomonas mossii]|nr:hypothetical protein [Dysgonomonas mossii]